MKEYIEPKKSIDTKDQNKDILAQSISAELSDLMSEIDLTTIEKYNNRLETFHNESFDGLSGISPEIARATQQRVQGAARLNMAA